MAKICCILLLLLSFSCSIERGDNATSIYKDILPELIKKEPYFNQQLAPPPPPPARKEGESREEYHLRIREEYHLRIKVKSLEKIARYYMAENNKAKEIHLLKRLLPMNPDSFKSAGIFEFIDNYDSTWVGKPRLEVMESPMTMIFPKEGIKAGAFDIHLIDDLPEPFSVEEKKDLRLFYLQLSSIMLNEEKTKGVFYYAVASDQNAYGKGGYAYIAKEKSSWVIKSLEK